jgi:glycosyltransferase involved in cell wall biosynthesis
LKRVLRIIGRLNVGGPAIHTVLLTHLLDKDKYPTHLVTGVEGPTEGSMRYLAEERGVETLIIPEMGREISWKDDIVALWKLMVLMRREKQDIIHTHTAKAGTLGRIAALIALFGRRKRLYHTFHGHIFHSYFSPLKTKVFMVIERLLGRYSDRLIAVSENTKQELVAYKIAPEPKISVIPLGLDLDPFAACERFRGELRKELGFDEDTILIGLVARLVPVKGICYFLEAVQCIAERNPRVRVVIVGDGELRQDLESQAQALGLTEVARFIGYRKDLARIYADLDIVALSSLNEGLPVSIIEAMSSGCVVVSTAVGGVPNLITEGETGFLAPPRNSVAYAQALQKALDAPECWAEIGKRARASALSRFHISRLVADIENLYDANEQKK